MRNENEPRGRQKRCALVVDDTSYTRDLSSITLQRLGFAKVIKADSADAALAALSKEGPSNIDLVVTDIEMGDRKKTGIWLAGIIRSGNPDLPIIIMSSSMDSYKAQADPITPYTVKKGAGTAFAEHIMLVVSNIFGIG